MKKYVALFFEIFSVFPANHKKKLILFQLLIVAVSFVEVMGIASIMPFVSALSNPELILKNPHFASAFQFLGLDSTRDFLLISGSVFLAFMITGNFLNAFNIWAIHLFVAKARVHFVRQLFKFYLNQDFVDFSSCQSSTVISNLTFQIDRLLSSVALQFMTINSRAITLLFLFVALVWVNPQITLVIFAIFFASYLTIYKSLKKKMAAYGENLSKTGSRINQTIIETVGGFREIKVYRLERDRMNRLESSSASFARSNSFRQLIGLLPRYLIETIAFGSLVLLCFYFIEKDGMSSELFPLVSLYAVAGYRILPQMQQIYGGISEIKSNLSAFDSIKEVLRAAKRIELSNLAQEPQKTPFAESIRFEEVSFKYPGTHERQLKNISLTVRKNKSVGFVGKTGCGKTTLINIFLGLIRQDSGRVLLDGRPLKTGEEIRKWQKNIAFVSQDLCLLDADILENIGFGSVKKEIDFERAREAARIADIADFVESLPEGYHTSVGERGIKLSGGQKQRIAIARALYREPEVLVLDEATSSLDQATENNLMQSIEKIQGLKTLVMIAHRVNTLRKCDVIHVLDDGVIAASGTYEELLEKSERFRSFANAPPASV